MSNSFTDSFESELWESKARGTSTSKRSTTTSLADETPAVQAGNGDTMVVEEDHQKSKKRNTSGNNELLFAAEMTMVTKHASLQDVWDKWFRLGAYHDGFA